jgi:DNA-binding transcriptional LysR family regulator
MADLSTLNLNLLVALDALLAERSVTRAGERIGLAQSSMSHALASLRAIFDDPLLVRSSDGMVPTPRAQELEGPLRGALEMLGAAIETPAGFDPARASLTLILASDAIQQVILLPRLLARLDAQAPGVVLHTEAPVAAGETFRRLQAAELDVALGHFDEPPAGIRRETFATDRIVYVARKGHPRARKRARGRTRDRRERLLVQTPLSAGQDAARPRPIAPHALRGAGSAMPAVIATTPHSLASLFIVSQTDIVTGTVERVAEMYKDVLGLSVFPAPVEMAPVETHMIWHERTDRSPAHQWLRGLLDELADSGAVS